VLVEDNVSQNPQGLAGVSVSSDGVLVFRAGEILDDNPVSQMQWFGRDGRSLGSVGEPGSYEQSRLSPDGRTVAFARYAASVGAGAAGPGRAAGGGRDIWTLDLSSNIQSRLTLDSIRNTDPTWFPDSRELAFLSFTGRRGGFYRKVLGASAEMLIHESNIEKYLDDVSSDGRFLLYHANNQLIALPLAGGTSTAASDSISNKDSARFSPDGRWISYGSLESDQWEVYVASFPDFQNKKQVSLGGGMQARWRADGRELLYLSPSGMVMSVTVSPGSVPTFSAPAPLFQSPLGEPDPLRDTFDATRDGQRFLLLVREQLDVSLPPITVVVNWRAGLAPR
jgi:Tol biopolymer transport system component